MQSLYFIHVVVSIVLIGLFNLSITASSSVSSKSALSPRPSSSSISTSASGSGEECVICAQSIPQCPPACLEDGCVIVSQTSYACSRAYCSRLECSGSASTRTGSTPTYPALRWWSDMHRYQMHRDKSVSTGTISRRIEYVGFDDFGVTVNRPVLVTTRFN